MYAVFMANIDFSLNGEIHRNYQKMSKMNHFCQLGFNHFFI